MMSNPPRPTTVEPERRFFLWMLTKKQRDILTSGFITLFALWLAGIYLMPLGYGIVTSLKSKEQAQDPRGVIMPSAPRTFEYEGESYDVYQVPTDAGIQEWALVKPGREQSSFVDPANPDAGLIEWEGRWRTLEPALETQFEWENYNRAWETVNFPNLFWNTLVYAFVTMIGAVGSAAFVAYGFARFKFPYKNLLFVILIATIILPTEVTLVPTYALFTRIGWTGTWLPLMIPQFFGNAYNVFLLRQYFMTIPREMEDAAAIDGAGPLRTFLTIILPQAIPAITAVSLFHFFWAWNDFFGPLIYLVGKTDLFPISVGLTFFNGLYSDNPELILAASIVALALPLVIFFLAQRVFMQGVVVTGVDK
jgi:multiple sugar transport system permease protein